MIAGWSASVESPLWTPDGDTRGLGAEEKQPSLVLLLHASLYALFLFASHLDYPKSIHSLARHEVLRHRRLSRCRRSRRPRSDRRYSVRMFPLIRCPRLTHRTIPQRERGSMP